LAAYLNKEAYLLVREDAIKGSLNSHFNGAIYQQFQCFFFALPHRSRSLAFRARIVLECASGESNAAVAAKLRTTGFTVGMWRNRFITEGMVGLGDEIRPGAPRQIGDDRVERAVRLTLEEAPKGATHWSSRALAARTGLSQST